MDYELANVDRENDVALLAGPAPNIVPVNPAGSPRERSVVNNSSQISRSLSLATYQVNWNNIDPETKNGLKNNSTCKRVKEAVVHYVIAELRALNNYERVAEKYLQRVADQLCCRYPNTFLKLVNGKVSGTGSSTILEKLKNRNNLVHRNSDQNSLKARLKPACSKLRFMESMQSGCSDWQPNLPEGVTEQSLEEKRIFLLNYSNHLKNAETFQTVGQYLQETYCLQRLFLNQVNKIPSVLDIKSTWPILLDSYGLLHNFRRLTSINDMAQIYSNLSCTISLILSYTDNVINKPVVNKDGTPYTKFYRALQHVCAHFKEKIEDVFITYPVSTL